MRKWLGQVVWTSVAAVLLLAVAFINAYAGNMEFVIAAGSGAITAAILATRER